MFPYNPLLFMSDVFSDMIHINTFFAYPHLLNPNFINQKIRLLGNTEQNSIIVEEMFENKLNTQFIPFPQSSLSNSQQIVETQPQQRFQFGINKKIKKIQRKRNVDLASNPHIQISYLKFPQQQKSIDPIIITMKGISGLQEQKANYLTVGKQSDLESISIQPDIQLTDQGVSPLHCKLYTKDVFTSYFSVEKDFMTLLCICDRRTQSYWQNLPLVVLQKIYQYTKPLPSLLVKDLGSSQGTYVKVNRTDPNILFEHQNYLIGADTVLLILGVNNNRISTYSEEYFFNCLLKEIDKGVELHGLTIDESERFNKFYSHSLRKRSRAYKLSICGRPYLKTEFQTKGIVQRHLFLEKQQDKTAYIIGRSQDSDVIITLNTVSRRQSQIIYDQNNKQWQIFDGGENKDSANGTWEALKIKKSPSFKSINGGSILKISDTQLKIDFINFDIKKKRRKLNLELTNKLLIQSL